MSSKIFCILGPTAVGKTDVSIELAQKLNAEIVSVDSVLVYKEFDIGTAKPTKDEQNRIPHHGLDLVAPDQEFSVYDFCLAAKNAITDIHRREKSVLLVGGSGFYLKALERGMIGAPPSDDKIRREIETEIETQGLEVVYEKLKEIDPISCQKIHSHDRYRIIRAWEIYRTGGKPLSQYYAEHKSKAQYDFKKIGLNLESQAHFKKIQERTQTMLSHGLLDEVKWLMDKYDIKAKPFSSVGYRSAVQYLRNEITQIEFIQKMNLETRQLAKQQLTWFRRDFGIQWIKDTSFLNEIILNH